MLRIRVLAFALICLWSLPLAAQEAARVTALEIFEKMVANAPAGAVSYRSAEALGEAGLRIEGLEIRTWPSEEQAGVLTVERVVLSEIGPLDPEAWPPEVVDLTVTGLVLTPENSGLDANLFAALGTQRLSLDLTLRYLYLPETDLLSVRALSIDLPFVAKASATLDAAGVDLLAILKSEKALDRVVLRQATVTFHDRTLLSRLLLFSAKREGITYDEAEAEVLREMAEELNWLGVPRGGRLWSLAQSLGGLVLDAATPRGPLSASLRPQAAVSLAQVRNLEEIEDAARILNLRSSYAGSRAVFEASAQSAPGRPDLTLETARQVYRAGETVEVKYAGLPGNQRDWVTVVPLGTPRDQWGRWTYTDGKTSGSFEVADLEPGAYEARLYLDWPRGGFDVVRSWSFSVEP